MQCVFRTSVCRCAAMIIGDDVMGRGGMTSRSSCTPVRTRFARICSAATIRRWPRPSTIGQGSWTRPRWSIFFVFCYKKIGKITKRTQSAMWLDLQRAALFNEVRGCMYESREKRSTSQDKKGRSTSMVVNSHAQQIAGVCWGLGRTTFQGPLARPACGMCRGKEWRVQDVRSPVATA